MFKGEELPHTPEIGSSLYTKIPRADVQARTASWLTSNPSNTIKD